MPFYAPSIKFLLPPGDRGSFFGGTAPCLWKVPAERLVPRALPYDLFSISSCPPFLSGRISASPSVPPLPICAETKSSGRRKSDLSASADSLCFPKFPVFRRNLQNRRVGVDAHIYPLGTIEFVEGFYKIGLICRDGVGVVPYAPIEKTKRADRKQSFLSAFFHKCLSKSQGT